MTATDSPPLEIAMAGFSDEKWSVGVVIYPSLELHDSSTSEGREAVLATFADCPVFDNEADAEVYRLNLEEETGLGWAFFLYHFPLNREVTNADGEV